MNDWRSLLLPLLFAVLVLAATAVFIASYFSLTAALIFCSIGALWIGFGMYFLRDPQADPPHSGARYEQYAKKIPSSFEAPEHGKIVRTRVPLAIEAPAAAAKPSLAAEAASSTPAENTGYRQTLVDGVIEIQKLINKTNDNLARYQTVMGKRVGKTSGTEHRSLITARRVLTALDDRINLLKRSIDNYDNGKDDRAEALALLKSPLIVPHDPVTALPGEEPLPPIAPEAFESTLKVLCKQIARKPSFLQLLGVVRNDT